MAEVHLVVGCALILLNLVAFAVGGIAWIRDEASVPFWYLLRAAQGSVFLQALLGGLLVLTGHEPDGSLHYLYGILPGGPAGGGPGDRPPRDGHHGRQLRSDPLPRPPRRRNQRRVLIAVWRI
jgi:hypothetical protein